ncbi:tetratricopeptide repeat protein [Dysgonomonas sp. 25]|uniref:tetratricopeptide repeat protein n=1 Tax=Dysgonomonas sp. 25 TaxID=2302933 RepID=UPI0013D04CA6|nr:tetratricopeptide repeat protein [Dysgonomonas sp. 25]NDV68648.1 hypothetical protein [Dysgonomonas sp. 25]
MKITKNKTNSKLANLASIPLLIAFILLVAISCSSHSVRDVRATKGGKKSKKSKTTSTTAAYEPRKLSKEELKRNMDEMRQLFMLRETVNVDMPDMRGLGLDSVGTLVVDPNAIIANWEKNRTAAALEEVLPIDTLPAIDTLADTSLEADLLSMDTSLESDSIGNDSLIVDSLIVDGGDMLVTDSLDLAVEPLQSDTIAVTDDLDLYADDNEDIYATAPEGETTYSSYVDEGPVSLSEIVAKSKNRYIPERNRKINTGFVIYVPKALISPSWRMTITPKFIMNDSVRTLPEVVLKGSKFLDNQKLSYQDYEDFQNSIVSKDDYDNQFLDYDGIKSDMKARQDMYYDKYYEAWKLQVDYEKWKNRWSDDRAFEAALKVAERKELYHQAQRAARDEKFKLLAAGRDTAGVYAEHMKRFTKKSKKLPEVFEKPVLTVNDVPKKYRRLFIENRKIEHIRNAVLTEADSIEISKHHYLVDEIAMNEFKDSTREYHRQLIIPFPYEQGTRVDTIVDGSEDFLYYYPQETIIDDGKFDFRLVTESKIENFGMNTFHFPQKDTMEYQVTSLVDLINPDLYIKETTINRNMYHLDILYPKFESEKWDFKIGYQDNKSVVQAFMDDYQKYVLDKGFILDSAYVEVSTSLDGSWNFNAQLTINRANALRDYLMKKEFPQLNEGLFDAVPRGEDWNTFVRLLQQRDDMPNKEAIIEMIENMVDPDETERSIRRTYKRDYKIMQDSIYPKLKKAVLAVFFHRPNMDTETAIQRDEIPGYQEALQMMRERRYNDAVKSGALTIHPDYNTALLLTCMGDFEQAYSLLNFLAPDADIYYLMAIVAYHLGKEEEAVEHLKSAIDIDPDKAKRVPMDPEMVLLVEKYNL